MSKKTPRIYSPASTLRQMTLINMQKRSEKALFRYLGTDGAVKEVTYGDFHYTCEKLIAAFQKHGLRESALPLSVRPVRNGSKPFVRLFRRITWSSRLIKN